MNATHIPAPTRRPPRVRVDTLEQQRVVDDLVLERRAMRERGEVPPLPDPFGRRRGGRVHRIACGVELRQREVDGTISDEEAEWLRLRREHLAAWQQGRAQRIAIRKAKASASVETPANEAGFVEVVGTPGSPKSLRAVPAEQWRGQLKGPDDLRALVARVRGMQDTP
jgi:hypothetical protein